MPAAAAPSAPGAAAGEALMPAPVVRPIGGDRRSILAKTMDAWDPQRMSRLRATLENLRTTDDDWTWDDFLTYLLRFRRLKPDTIGSTARRLRFMERYPASPVQIHGTRSELVNTFCVYVTYRETVEGAPASTTVNDHKAIRSLGEFLGIPAETWPTAPTPQAEDQDLLPDPEHVRLLLHTDVLPNAKRNPENALVRYLLAFDFGFGIRFPSEAHAMVLHDFDPARHLLVVTEPKKDHRRRRILIEPRWLCCSKRHMSLANWLRWREQLDPRTDALFPRPDGKEWTSKYALNRLLFRFVKPRFPWFHPYLGRHWSVNARLIEWGFDYARVAQWHGHDDARQVLRHYERSARLHQALYGDRWLLRAFQRPPAPQPKSQPGEPVHPASDGIHGPARI